MVTKKTIRKRYQKEPRTVSAGLRLPVKIVAKLDAMRRQSSGLIATRSQVMLAAINFGLKEMAERSKDTPPRPQRRVNRQITFIDLEDILIVGFDTEDGPEHPLWNERSDSPVPRLLFESIWIMEVIEPIHVIKYKGLYLVVDGRQRVKACREVNAKLADLKIKPRQIPAIIHLEFPMLFTQPQPVLEAVSECWPMM